MVQVSGNGNRRLLTDLTGSFHRGSVLDASVATLGPSLEQLVFTLDPLAVIRTVPSGRYRLFAVEDASNLEYTNPVAIRPFIESAKRINVIGKSVLTGRIDLNRQQ